VAHVLKSLLQVIEGVLQSLLIGAAESAHLRLLCLLRLWTHLAALLLLALLAGLLAALTHLALLSRLTRLAGLT
jgi:hypothetical protein